MLPAACRANDRDGRVVSRDVFGAEHLTQAQRDGLGGISLKSKRGTRLKIVTAPVPSWWRDELDVRGGSSSVFKNAFQAF